MVLIKKSIFVLILLVIISFFSFTCGESSNIGFNAVWENNSDKHLSFTDTARIRLTVTNQRLESFTPVALFVEYSNDKVGVSGYPTTISLQDNKDEIVYLTVRNLGVTQEVDNIPITLKGVTDLDGLVAQDVIYVTLLPMLPSSIPDYSTESPTPLPNSTMIDYTTLIAVSIICLTILSTGLILLKYKKIK
jgi:hypothetical protein